MRTRTHTNTQAHTVAWGHNNSFTHIHTRQDGEVAITYFSGFQQDLSLLLVLPLLLDSLQLLEEAQLRANVCRLLVALVVLAGRQRGNHCKSNFLKAATERLLLKLWPQVLSRVRAQRIVVEERSINNRKLRNKKH